MTKAHLKILSNTLAWVNLLRKELDAAVKQERDPRYLFGDITEGLVTATQAITDLKKHSGAQK